MEKEKFDVASYWDKRYSNGGTSGMGSQGFEAILKANVINKFIDIYKFRTIVELGCGDGVNLQLYNIPISYCGYDISPKAVELCNQRVKSLKFYFTSKMDEIDFGADVCLSLDVYYHLIDDKVFQDYCNLLFNGGWKYIIVYTIDTDSEFIHTGEKQAEHLKQRSFTNEYQKYEWELVSMLSGYKSSDDKVLNFPGDKKFFLLKNKLR